MKAWEGGDARTIRMRNKAPKDLNQAPGKVPTLAALAGESPALEQNNVDEISNYLKRTVCSERV